MLFLPPFVYFFSHYLSPLAQDEEHSLCLCVIRLVTMLTYYLLFPKILLRTFATWPNSKLFWVILVIFFVHMHVFNFDGSCRNQSIFEVLGLEQSQLFANIFLQIPNKLHEEFMVIQV